MKNFIRLGKKCLIVCNPKLLFIMRLSILISFLLSFSVFATSYSQDARINLDVKTATTVKSVLKMIEDQTKFRFFYNSDLVDLNKQVIISLEDKNINEVLNSIFAGTAVGYRVLENNFVVLSLEEMLQQITITGTVNDEAGEPMPGVNVVVKGTTTGVITSSNGSYSITVPDKDATLIFSFLGYTPQEIVVGSQREFIITLKEETRLLDEIVVVGYGTQRKRDLTGAITSVSADQINETAKTNAVQALQGKVAGVDIRQDSWNPGSTGNIQIRGRRSITALNEPLYVIDGIPIDRGINEINPSEIESMEILKDASATAIYGSGGANGVVLITTKRGRSGKTHIEYDGYYGVQKPLNTLDIMNGPEFAEFVREAYRNRSSNKYNSDVPNMNDDKNNGIFGKDAYVMESVMMGYDADGKYNPNNVRSFDWVDAVMRTGNIQNHQLTITGGGEKTRLMVSGAYFANEGVMRDKDYSRLSLRTNIDHDFNKWLLVGTSMMYSNVVQNSSGNLYERARNMSPLATAWNEDGSLVAFPGGDGLAVNPLAEINGRQTENDRNRFIYNFYTEVKLPFNFKYRFNFGLDYRTARDGSFVSSMALSGGLPTAGYGGNSLKQYTYNNILYYDNTFNKIHRLNLTLLQEAIDYRFEESGINVKGLPAEYQRFYNVGSASEVTGVSSRLTERRMLSWMGRVNYSLKDKYLLTVSGRYDGSSVMADGHKYQFFPSASVAWRIMEEPFMASTRGFLDNLKLRFGYGKTGNSAISAYQTQGSLQLMRYVWDETLQISYAPGSMPNPGLSWETTGQYNLGIDFAFFGNRISGTIDMYRQNTYDLLMARNLPIVSGFNSVMENIGKTRNTGFEFSLTTRILETEDWNWSVDWMYYTNKEEIVELYGGKKDDVGSKWFIGQPISVHYDYAFDGIWQDTPEDLAEIAKFNANGASFKPGLIRPKDQNGDYKINAEDRVILGTTQPDWIGSITSHLSYKNLDFSFQLYGNFGSMVYNDMNLRMEGRWNSLKVDYWTPTNPSTTYPRPSADWENPPYVNILYYEKASYVRLRYLTLGYSLPQKLREKIACQKFRIYGTIQNPFLWTDFKGLDPEGAAGYNTPSVTTFLLGLNIAF